MANARLKEVAEALAALPTKNDLWQWRLQWTGIAVAAVAIIVGSIIGGLAPGVLRSMTSLGADNG